MARNKIRGKNTRPKSNLATGRNYSYDKEYESSKRQIKNRVKRNAARRQIAKSRGRSAIRGKDVDHRRSLKSGGSNKRSNLRIQTIKRNRGRK